MATARADSGAPRRVVGAIKRVVGLVETSSAGAAKAIDRQIEETRRELSRREAELRHARQEFAEARAALEACLSRPPANCGGPAQAVARAESEVRRADRRVRVAREVLATLTAERSRFESRRRRLAAGLAQHTEQSLRELFAASGALDSYLAGRPATGTQGGSFNPPAAPGGGGPPAHPSGPTFTYGAKIERQMVGREWNDSAIAETIAHGRQIPVRNVATGSAAVRYVHPTTGRSVVIDSDSGEVIQVGDYGFRYGPGEAGTQ